MSELIRQFNTGKTRKMNPEYTSIQTQKRRIGSRINELGKTPELLDEFRRLDSRQRTLPSKDSHDPNYRRLRYCRYADDFVAGVIGTRDEAFLILEKVKTFLWDKLSLRLSDEKTRVEKATGGMEFLSVSIRTRKGNKILKYQAGNHRIKKRTKAFGIRLEVPKRVGLKFCQKYGYGDWSKTKPNSRHYLTVASELEIIHTYNSELRGLANYYRLASDILAKLKKLEYLVPCHRRVAKLGQSRLSLRERKQNSRRNQ